jgi:uncharacterized membrane protein YgcG
MKDKILPILLVSSILVSCSSVYKSGQTPDDVYYSPAREVVKTEQKDEEKVEEKTTTTDDQYLKMKVRDRYRWSRIDDYDYWVDTRYNNHCSCTCNPPTYNFGYSYGYYPIRYNTYPVLAYYNPHYIKGNTSASNIKAYGNHTYSNSNAPVNPKTGSATNSAGSLLKRVFTSSGSSVDRSQRTFEPSSSSSSSSTSSSAGGKSGGYNSTGSSTSGGRGGRGN